MSCEKSVCPQRIAATTVYFQPPAVDTRGLTLAQSISKGWSVHYQTDKAKRRFTKLVHKVNLPVIGLNDKINLAQFHGNIIGLFL